MIINLKKPNRIVLEYDMQDVTVEPPADFEHLTFEVDEDTGRRFASQGLLAKACVKVKRGDL